MRDPLCATANALREFDAQAREYEKQVPSEASRHQLLVIQNGGVHVMRLLQDLQAMVKQRRRKLLAAIRQLRSSNKTAEFTKNALVSRALDVCRHLLLLLGRSEGSDVYTDRLS